MDGQARSIAKRSSAKSYEHVLKPHDHDLEEGDEEMKRVLPVWAALGLAYLVSMLGQIMAFERPLNGDDTGIITLVAIFAGAILGVQLAKFFAIQPSIRIK